MYRSNPLRRLLMTGCALGAMALSTLVPAASARGDGHTYPELTPAQIVELRDAIDEMTRNPRGPYLRIRWFCEDGTVLPPGPFACRPHGGGVQHAEMREEIAAYADLGFHFGPVFQALEPADVIDSAHAGYRARELVVQAYLERADDGWVMRRARYYRGARQAEDEERAGQEILQTALGDADWVRGRPLLASRLVETIPHAGSGSLTQQIRALAVDAAELDPGFTDLRVKLHSVPGPADIDAVRMYRNHAGDRAEPELLEILDELVGLLTAQYGDGLDPERWRELAAAGGQQDVAAAVDRLVGNGNGGPLERLHLLASVAATSRRAVDEGTAPSGRQALALIELASEAADRAAVVVAGWYETEAARQPTRRTLLAVAGDLLDAAYADGWLTPAEHAAQTQAIGRLVDAGALTAGQYHSAIRYLERAPSWAHAAARQTFAMVTERYLEVEPVVHGFEDDLLRGSVLLPLSRVLSELDADAGIAIGQEHEIFDTRVRTGVLGLNPGVAIGPLYVAESLRETMAPDPAGIYVLPETPPELGRVAGILTLGQGSRLSHVQLLARGLGIPNAAVDPSRLADLRDRVGEQVVYSVSPRGSVHLDVIRPEDRIALERQRQERSGSSALRIDESRLDLSVRSVLPLESVDAADAGRIAGPKAANLGQLHKLFPDRVAPGLVIPFGVFRAHIERQPADGGPSLAEDIARLFHERTDVRERLAALRARIETMPLLAEFEQQLRTMLRDRFGESGSYGVFVRSDTNVEDLPNFSGAGLNLTVMNVIGEEQILDALRRVWASPFTERAYGWRAEAVENPEAIYPSIVILGSVPSEASGVLVTRDVDDVMRDASGATGHWTITLSPGVGGAVSGEETETNLVRADGAGEPLLLSSARAPYRMTTQTAPPGGMLREPVEADAILLTPARLRDLRQVVNRIQELYPPSYDAAGDPMPWDIEFGFLGDRTVLFQIRPFLAGGNTAILDDARALDALMEARATLPVDLDDEVSR